MADKEREIIHMEICKSVWKEGTWNIRIGDIKGSTENSNCSEEDMKWEIDEAIKQLKGAKEK